MTPLTAQSVINRGYTNVRVLRPYFYDAGDAIRVGSGPVARPLGSSLFPAGSKYGPGGGGTASAVDLTKAGVTQRPGASAADVASIIGSLAQLGVGIATSATANRATHSPAPMPPTIAYPPVQAQPQAAPVWPWIVGGVGVVAMLGGVVVLASRRR